MLPTQIKVQMSGSINNPTILFLHAFPFSGDMWKEQMTLLSDKYFCLAPDLPGFGESAQREDSVTFEYYVDSVLSYLKEMKIENAIWCGLSMGGYIALRMYEREPDLCQALILCDTKAGPDNNEAKLKRWSAIQMLKKNRSEFIASQWQALIGESSKNNDTLKKRFEELIAKVSDKGIITGLAALATRTDSTPNLSNINVPTLILVGEDDKVTPVSESQVMSNAIHGSQMIVLNQTGHLSNLENPVMFNNQLSSFLKGTGYRLHKQRENGHTQKSV
jgi:3-oxoadipate enol-lactonase